MRKNKKLKNDVEFNDNGGWFLILLNQKYIITLYFG